MHGFSMLPPWLLLTYALLGWRCSWRALAYLGGLSVALTSMLALTDLIVTNGVLDYRSPFSRRSAPVPLTRAALASA